MGDTLWNWLAGTFSQLTVVSSVSPQKCSLVKHMAMSGHEKTCICVYVIGLCHRLLIWWS